MSSISDGTTTINPQQILGYESARKARNITHAILGTNVPAVSLRQAALRTGKLTALCKDRAEALALETVLSSDNLLTFTDTDTTLSMTFVLEGETVVSLDEDSSVLWVVEFGYTEVV